MTISASLFSYKCLTIAQPWAWAIVRAGKRVENRRWSTTHRGAMLIHAGKSHEWMENGMSVLRGLQACGELKDYRDGPDGTYWYESQMLDVPKENELEYGAVVGICEVLDCVRPGVAAIRAPGQRVWIDGHAMSSAWMLGDVRMFEKPVRMSGQQGLFEVQPHAEMRWQIERAVEAHAIGRSFGESTGGLFGGAGKARML